MNCVKKALSIILVLLLFISTTVFAGEDIGSEGITAGEVTAGMELHAFYAIQSHSQIDFIDGLSSVGFGWSRLEYHEEQGFIINTKRQDGNEYGFPDGYETPFQAAKSSGADALLMVSLDYGVYPDGQSLASYFLSNLEYRQTVAELVAKQVWSPLEFDGVVIDFENIRADQKENFTDFLQAVKTVLKGKKLYVAVQPARKPGLDYFDGYDYKAIGSICDKVILMAHDYAPKTLSEAELEIGYTTTPVAPINEVYYALQAITDKETGVDDVKKIILQLSFDSIALRVEDGNMIPPSALSYGGIENEIRSGAEAYYSAALESPYIKFMKDNIQYVVWYEDARSVAAKIKLAETFGIRGISLWRLGIVPNGGADIYFNVWETIRYLLTGGSF